MPRSGPTWETNDDWRRRVDARLVELGNEKMGKPYKRAWLADQLGCNRSVVTEMLRTDEEAEGLDRKPQRRSTYVADVHRILEWPDPVAWMLTEDEEALVLTYRALDDGAKAAARADVARRIKAPLSAAAVHRKAVVTGALSQAIAAQSESPGDQTPEVPSDHEGRTGSRRPRRPSGRG